jgi:hypothetical protein
MMPGNGRVIKCPDVVLSGGYFGLKGEKSKGGVSDFSPLGRDPDTIQQAEA